MKCQARVLLTWPRIFLSDGAQVFMTRPCAAALDETTQAPEAPLCAACFGLWGEPIHGFVDEEPPATTHCYESVWFKERLAAGATIANAHLAILRGEAEVPKRRVIIQLRPKEAKPPVTLIKLMPPKRNTAHPPPPPSSPTHGSLPAPPAPSAAAAKVAAPKRKKATAAAKTATPSRKRSPTARIADKSGCVANAVGIGTDFERTKQSAELLRSLLHVFEPTAFEEDGEPLEFDDYEYVKLEREGDHFQTPTGQRFSYSVEKGVVAI